MNNVEHNKNRKAFDSLYAIALYDKQVRESLAIKMEKTPNKNVHWPDKNPVIGVVYE